MDTFPLLPEPQLCLTLIGRCLKQHNAERTDQLLCIIHQYRCTVAYLLRQPPPELLYT